MTENGRSNLIDFYQELLDGVLYFRAMLEEGRGTSRISPFEQRSGPFLDPLDASYLAGLIDGEGCLSLRTHKEGYVHSAIEVLMTTREPLDWAHNVTGMGSVNLTKRKSPQRDAYRWVVTGVEKVDKIVSELRPYLKVKGMEATLLMAFADLKRLKARKGGPDENMETARLLSELVSFLKKSPAG